MAPAGAPAQGAGTRELPVAVLFACTLNAVRSPMAAAILRHLAGRRVYVQSAGVRAGEPDPFVAAVMDEIGIDLKGQVIGLAAFAWGIGFSSHTRTADSPAMAARNDGC